MDAVSSTTTLTDRSSTGSKTPTKDELSDYEDEDDKAAEKGDDDVFLVTPDDKPPPTLVRCQSTPTRLPLASIVKPPESASESIVKYSEAGIIDLEDALLKKMKESREFRAVAASLIDEAHRKRSLPEGLDPSVRVEQALYRQELKERLLWHELKDIFVDWGNYNGLASRVTKLEEEVEKKKMKKMNKNEEEEEEKKEEKEEKEEEKEEK